MNTKVTELSVEDRIRIVEDLWDSIANDQSVLPFTHDQKVELDRRLDTFEVDGKSGRLAADAISDIRRRL